MKQPPKYYALAKSLAEPVLYKGKDFSHTDLDTVLTS